MKVAEEDPKNKGSMEKRNKRKLQLIVARSQCNKGTALCIVPSRCFTFREHAENTKSWILSTLLVNQAPENPVTWSCRGSDNLDVCLLLIVDNKTGACRQAQVVSWAPRAAKVWVKDYVGVLILASKEKWGKATKLPHRLDDEFWWRLTAVNSGTIRK